MTSACVARFALLMLTSLVACGKSTAFSCLAGPPGKYCFDDLSGYHDCHVETKTGQMVDTPHTCSGGTRCICFLGASCPGSVQDPCGPFRAAPDFPHEFSIYGETKSQTIAPPGPSPVSARQTQIFQKLDKEKFRWNRNQLNYHESWFYLPVSGKQFSKYYVRWDKEFCNSTAVDSIPRFGVPTYFTYSGTMKLDWREVEKWEWHTGGRTMGDPRTSEYFYIYQDPNDQHYEPVRYEFRLYGTPISKTNVVSNTTYVFLPDVLDSEFDPPKQYCL